MPKVRGEWSDWFEMIEGNSNSDNHSLQPGSAETPLKLEADGLQM